MPQASELLPATIEALRVADPAESKFIVGLKQTALGEVTSFTVTVALQVAALLELSRTVTVCVTGVAIFAQVNVVCDIDEEETPHASELLPVKELAEIVTDPAEFKLTVVLEHTALGGVTSLTVIVVVQVPALLEESLTVTV